MFSHRCQECPSRYKLQFQKTYKINKKSSVNKRCMRIKDPPHFGIMYVPYTIMFFNQGKRSFQTTISKDLLISTFKVTCPCFPFDLHLICWIISKVRITLSKIKWSSTKADCSTKIHLQLLNNSHTTTLHVVTLNSKSFLVRTL